MTRQAPIDHDDLIVLTEWMAQTGDHTLDDMAEAVRKPRNYAAEIAMIRSLRAHEAANPGHSGGQDLYGHWVCDDNGPSSVSGCSWPDGDPTAAHTTATDTQRERARQHGH